MTADAAPPGERDLMKLLAGMTPRLDPAAYVFATIPGGRAKDEVPALMRFSEDEGDTLILTEAAAAAAGVRAVFPCRRIILEVASALDAVGFMAEVSAALTTAGVSCNVVAGFHHDHLFVQADKAADAMAALEALSGKGRAR